MDDRPMGFIAALVFAAWIGFVFYGVGTKAGQVHILSGGVPEYHLVTNAQQEVSWEPIPK